MVYYLHADRFLLEKEEKLSGFLKIEKDRFGKFVDDVPEHANVVDFSGYTIAPGLFDTHIHGINNYDVMDGNVEAIEQISQALARLGVTRFLPTTLTSDQADLEKALVSITAAVEAGLSGAQSAGVFLEGPYFTEKYRGAQNANYFRNPNYKEFLNWQQLAKGQIVKIALAPERDEAIQFIQSLSKENVYVSIGHSDASYECCLAALEAGATSFVHLFNGMSGLHHREPGVVGAALANENSFVELICDGIHVHRDIAQLVLRLKEAHVVLISDCMRAGQMSDGVYKLGEFSVNIADGIARTESGALAGSTLTMIEAVKNLVDWSGEPLHEIWHLGSLSPAKSIGKATEFGSITQGKYADYVVLDKNLTVQATAINGKIL